MNSIHSDPIEKSWNLRFSLKERSTARYTSQVAIRNRIDYGACSAWAYYLVLPLILELSTQHLTQKVLDNKNDSSILFVVNASEGLLKVQEKLPKLQGLVF